MAVDYTSVQTLWAKEMVAVYEQQKALLRNMVTTDGNINGSKYVFIVDGKASPATIRGSNGKIPNMDDSQSEVYCTLAEYHAKTQKISFNVANSSVDQRGAMQRRVKRSTEQSTDQLILAALNATTYNTGAGVPATVNALLSACEQLDSNEVPEDGQKFGLLTTRAWAQCMKIPQFTQSFYVGADLPFVKQFESRFWNGVHWFKHTRLPGNKSNAASCFIFHKASAGHALSALPEKQMVGYMEEEDYWWARSSTYQGSAMIQSSGCIKFVHDDTAPV